MYLAIRNDSKNKNWLFIAQWRNTKLGKDYILYIYSTQGYSKPDNNVISVCFFYTGKVGGRAKHAYRLHVWAPGR